MFLSGRGRNQASWEPDAGLSSGALLVSKFSYSGFKFSYSAFSYCASWEYKINSLETQLTEQREELDITNHELRELIRDKGDDIAHTPDIYDKRLLISGEGLDSPKTIPTSQTLTSVY